MYKFKFADIGEGLHEGTVGEILVKVGSTVVEGDSLFVVETDKVTSDIPCPVHGTIKEIHIKTGETVHVGDVTFTIDDGSGEAAAEEAPAVEEKEEESAASVVGDIKVSNKLMTNDFSTKPTPSANAGGSSKTVLATPVARKVAKEKGINISEVTGSGPNGRVLVKDVEGHTGGSSKSASTGVSAKAGFVASSTKPTGIRKAIARSMANSWSNVAYSSLTNEINMSSVWDQRSNLKNKFKEVHGFNLTFTALIAKATVMALQDFPILNSKYVEETDTLEHAGVVNLGIAVDTPIGLLVPVIKDAHLMTVAQIGQQIVELAGKAVKGKLKGSEMQGGTFTISNYGSAGAVSGVPVINYPEMGILGVGTIIDRVLARNESFYNGKIMNATCSFNHKWVDGGEAGRFISRIREILENPILLGGLDV